MSIWWMVCSTSWPPLRDLKRHSRGDILLRVLDVPRALAALRQNGVAVCEEEGLLRLPPMEDERLAARASSG